MSRKLLIAAVVFGSTCIPVVASAEAAASGSNPAEMPKDSWLSSMTPLLPELICKGFMQDAELKKRFEEIKMTYEQCVTLIPESTTKCQNDLYAQIPATIDAGSAATWGRSLGECIGRDFAEKYLVPKQ